MTPELPSLASRINAAHADCEAAARKALSHALEAGRLLCEAKAMIPHGQWLAWLATHCRLSSRTARLYMRLHEHRGLLGSKRQRVANLPIREAARLIAGPVSAKSPRELSDFELIDRIRKSIWTVWVDCPPEWKKLVIPKFRNFLEELEQTGDLGW